MAVRFCMDDFGTGYSSAPNLTNLPLDPQKTDPSFVFSVHAKHTDAVAVRTLIAMGNDGFPTVRVRARFWAGRFTFPVPFPCPPTGTAAGEPEAGSHPLGGAPPFPKSGFIPYGY